jgi:prepilin-type N-terminal cleavage/methylation domain-containing protein/prepilin-type processing-associated H-X9-DG protein
MILLHLQRITSHNKVSQKKPEEHMNALQASNVWKGLDIMKRTKGFTLVELLVVIAIIALLLSILMPSLQKARSSAKAIVCRSNDKQIGIAGNMFMNDHSQAIPPNMITSPQGFPQDRQYGYWPHFLAPYLATQLKVFFCPAAAPGDYIGSPLINKANQPFLVLNQQIPLTLAANITVCGTVNGGATTQNDLGEPINYDHVTTLLRVKQLDKTVWVIDSKGIKGSSNGLNTNEATCDYDFYSRPADSGPTDYHAYRHDDKLNVLFFDMHSSAVSAKKTLNAPVVPLSKAVKWGISKQTGNQWGGSYGFGGQAMNWISYDLKDYGY